MNKISAAGVVWNNSLLVLILNIYTLLSDTVMGPKQVICWPNSW